MDKYKVKLPKRIKNRWLKDLRSGEFKQTKGALCDDVAEGARTELGFCCLGVLATQWHSTRANSPIRQNTVLYEANETYLRKIPKEVLAALRQGFGRERAFKAAYRKKVGSHSLWEGADIQAALTSANDELGMSFKQIADFIEKRL